MSDNETNRLVKGALLLTLAGLISKILSAGYRIPLQNLTGDVGFYIYQQVYPIIGIAMMFALYGFPQAISKIMVDIKKSGNNLSLLSFYAPVFLILCIINGVIFLFLYFKADSMAIWIGDQNMSDTYQISAFLFLLVPFTALLRGIFQGNLYMKPTAYSQVFEQLIRVFLLIIAAILVARGIFKLYDIGQSAVIASVIGSMTAILVLILFFIIKRPFSLEKHVIPWKYYVKTVLGLGVIATLNHMVLLAIQFADTFTFIPGLMEYGLLQNEAKEAKGIFDRGQPLIQLGTVLGSSFALALIPTISKQKVANNEGLFYIRSALLFSFYLAVGATIGLITILPETNVLLYQDGKGTMVLQILILSIFLSSLAITGSSILQGMGYVKETAFFILIALTVKWLFNLILLSTWGITGGALSTVFSLFILFIMVMFDLKRRIPRLYFFKQIRWGALISASIIMILYIKMIGIVIPDSLTSSRFILLLYVLFIVLTGASVFLFSLLKGKAFSEKELSLLPYNYLFLQIFKGRKNDGKN